MDPLLILFFVLVSFEVVSGFVFAEVIRLCFFAKWSKRKSEFVLAWSAGAVLYAINIANIGLGHVTSGPVQTPMSNMDLMSAILIYPVMCLIGWPVILNAKDVWLSPPKKRG